MGKGGSKFVQQKDCKVRRSLVNTGGPTESALYWAERRVGLGSFPLKFWLG